MIPKWLETLEEVHRKIVRYAQDTIAGHGTTPVIGHHYLTTIAVLAQKCDELEQANLDLQFQLANK